jgi:hypothetical protein
MMIANLRGGGMRNLNLCAVALVLLTELSPKANTQSPHLVSISRSNLCVTEGTIDQQLGQPLSVNVSKMRAYLNANTQPLAEARFTYLGATPNESPLASGEMRGQFGLKRRAQDACNLVYAMWRIEPESKLVVSVKTNPGQHTSEQCGNRGYQNIKPRRSTPVPALTPGSTHTLRAQMSGAEMEVFADNTLVWEGSVGADVLNFDGPVGLRSDNARLLINFSAGPLTKQQISPGCRGHESE